MATMRATSEDMNLLHVVRVGVDDDVASLLQRRLTGADLILTGDVDHLKELQRAMSSHLLPTVQSKLNGTYKNIQLALSGRRN